MKNEELSKSRSKQYFPLYTLFGFITRRWLCYKPLFPPRCARRASNLLMFTISVSGEIKIHFLSIEHCNQIIQTIKTNNNRWIGETNTWGQRWQPHNDKTWIHNTFIQSSYKGKTYYIEWHSRDTLTGEQWELCELSVTMALGGRKPTPPQTCYGVILRGFKVSTVYWPREKWVGCAGVGDCSAR